MRLAFAVGAHLESEILLVDEVLAVGDAAFQQRCLGRIGEVARGGRSVLFVSHNMGAIQGFCSRAIWLAAGGIRDDGPPGKVVQDYLATVQAEPLSGQGGGGAGFTIERIVLRNALDEPTQTLRPCEDLTVELQYRSDRRIDRPYFWIAVQGQYGPLFVASMLFDGRRPIITPGAGALACRFRMPFLLPQMYTVRLGAREPDSAGVLFDTQPVAYFHISCAMREFGFESEIADKFTSDSTPIVVPYEWRFPDGARVAVDPTAPRARESQGTPA
jgi:lipopolysaccharide transport system ATP-binding protein